MNAFPPIPLKARLPYWLLGAMGLLFVFTFALGVRRMILEAQYRRHGADMQFTLESALYYRRVKMVHDTGRLPAHDPMIQYPEGIDPRTTYTSGSEPVYAALARLFPSSVPMPNRIRWIESAWFCLGVPLLALGLYGWTRRVGPALWGSLFYAASISSVIRSTGQELSHENFALPFLIAHWALAVSAPGARTPLMRLAGHAGSALALALALCNWDLIQFYVALRFLYVAWGLLRETPSRGSVFGAWRFDALALVAVGFLNPYHHAQGWLTSPTMGLVYGVAILSALRARLNAQVEAAPRWRAIAARTGVLIGAMGVTALLHRVWGPDGAYGHFSELLWAKLRFLNEKPADPSRLTFNQRILWVPALNSTDWRLALSLFPALLGLTIPSALLLWMHSKKSPNSGTLFLLFAFVVSAVAFWLFARFHVFLALFSCLILGVAWSALPAGRVVLRGVVAVLFGAGLVVETLHSVRDPGRWGRLNVYYKQLEELTGWMARHVAPDPVLANFGVSSSIAAYGKCAILLHPKFENAGLRDRVKAYGEKLFQGTEQEFRDWADEHGAQYYVHAFGEFSSEHPELQMRYFVNTLAPSTNSAAHGFEFDPDGRTQFIPLWRNVKYAVFRIITRADEVMARQMVRQAEVAFEKGDMDGTEEASLQALKRVPTQERALELLRLSAVLKESGFRAGGE